MANTETADLRDQRDARGTSAGQAAHRGGRAGGPFGPGEAGTAWYGCVGRAVRGRVAGGGQARRARMSSGDSADEKAPSLSITLVNSSALRALSAMTFSSMVPEAISR